MSQEFKVIISLLSSAVGQLFPDALRGEFELTDSNEIADLDWNKVWQLARRHRVLPMLARGLAAVPEIHPAADFSTDLQNYSRRQAQHALFHVSEVLNVLDLFGTLGITAHPYKGPFLALRGYGDIASREFSDLDVFAALNDIPVLENALVERGYKAIHKIPASCRKAYFKRQPSYDFEKWDGDTRIFRLEPHYLSVDPSLGKGLIVDSLQNQTDQIELAGRLVPTLTPEAEFLLMVTHHGCHEAWGGLRYLLDVSVWLNRFGDTLNWAWISEKLSFSGFTNLAAIGIRMSERLFGTLPVPDEIRQAGSSSRIEKLAERQLSRLESYPVEHNTRGTRFAFLFAALDSNRARFTLLSRHVARFFQPVYEDFEWTSVPRDFYPLYYLVRPIRLLSTAWSKIRP